MEFSKAFRVSTDYKDQVNQTWEMLQFVEIAFIDSTHRSNKSSLYQLSDRKLTLEDILNIGKSGMQGFSRNTFVLVGEINHMDKRKKQIFLANNNVVTYNHLVIASGNKSALSFKDDELTAALQALTDALRVKPKIPDSFPSCLKSPSALVPPRKGPAFAAINKPLLIDNNQNIGEIAHPYMTPSKSRFKSGRLGSPNSRFYEVQI